MDKLLPLIYHLVVCLM